jgi:hypothetical protein
MQRLSGQFHLIDMASQAGAVQELLTGLSQQEKMEWIAAHCSLEFVSSPVPGCRDVYRFVSHLGLGVCLRRR